MNETFSSDPKIFGTTRLQAYGYAVATVYAALLVLFYWRGAWIVGPEGSPLYTDFACAWAATLQALHGNVARLFDPAAFAAAQTALVGPGKYFYPNWPYPPTFFLAMAPFTALPYRWGFIAWDALTLLGFAGVVYLIVRRRPALALVLASPFTLWNFLFGQNGFLTGALLGAALLTLERQPVLAGVFIGCLTYKPQFGILIPIALAAAKQWRTFAGAAAMAGLLAVLSIAGFGAAAWAALPREIAAQMNENIPAAGAAGTVAQWGYVQTIYGLVRDLHGNAQSAWLAQIAVSLALVAVVWIVWRSPVRHALKAAVLSAAALLATPYAFAYDMAALAIPVAFLAKDQVERGFLRWERGTALVGFAALLAALAVFWDRPNSTTFGSIPAGPIAAIVLLAMILRRALVCPEAAFGR